MPGSGTRTFLEPDHYEASLRQAKIEILVTLNPQFKARLTWAELHDLEVLRCEEDFPRVAYVCLGPQLSFVTFPAHSGPVPVWSGTELRAGEIVFHGRGERLHQSTPGSFAWNVIALDPLQLERYGRALSGKPFSLPSEGKILRPSPRNVARLRRLHAQVCRLAETKPKLLAHTEVARAIEQGLIQTLVACLTAPNIRADGPIKRRHARIMIRFEEVLAEHLSKPLHTTELCELIGVTERTLRSCCAEFLGMSPVRYVLLRRLSRARVALRDADPDEANLSELVRGFGFAELGRFEVAYRAAFRETPLTTLQRAPGARFINP
ncbi:MAG: helix-turn-helix domain-containing protein [Stellaceae bacterium]